MNLSKIMIANAVFAVIGALILIFNPLKMIESYGVMPERNGIIVGGPLIPLGAVFLGLAIIYFRLRKVKEREVIRTLSLAAIVAHGGSALFGVIAVLSGAVNNLPLVDIVIHALFALGFWQYGLNRK